MTRFSFPSVPVRSMRAWGRLLTTAAVLAGGLATGVVTAPTASAIAVLTLPLPATVSNGQVGVAYSQTVAATGGTPPLTYQVTAGALPAGVNLNLSTGALSGTPTAAGATSFTVKVTDSAGVPQTDTQTYTPSFSAPTIVISPATVPVPAVGAPYSQQLTASGGTAPYTYSVASGTLPAGIALTTTGVNAGLLSGTPTATGPSSFTIKAIDSSTGTGSPFNGTQAYSTIVNIGTHVTVSSSANPSPFGQIPTFTATVAPITTGQTAVTGGSVQWLVNSVAVGSPVTVTASGTATYTPATAMAVGSQTVSAAYSGDATHAASTSQIVQVVNKAATHTSVVVTGGSTLSATVTVVTPGAGVPTGTVTFSVGGSTVGTSPLAANGSASVSDPSVGAQVVTATYGGDTSFAGSSGSTTPVNPTITGAASSTIAETSAGWYRAPVTVTFTCTPGSAPINSAGCPAPVTLTSEGAAQSVSRTVTDTLGDSATATVNLINIDLTRPTVRVTGATNGRTYSFAHRSRFLTCHGTDALSGVASCHITKTVHLTKNYRTVHYTAVATDNAGNSSRVSGHYRTARHA